MQLTQWMGSLSKLSPVFNLKAGENKCKMTTEHPGIQTQPGMCGPRAKGKSYDNAKHEWDLWFHSGVTEIAPAMVSRQHHSQDTLLGGH